MDLKEKKIKIRPDGSGLGISLHPLPGLTLGWHQLPTRAGMEYLCREKRNVRVSCSFPTAFIWRLNLREKRGGERKEKRRKPNVCGGRVLGFFWFQFLGLQPSVPQPKVEMTHES